MKNEKRTTRKMVGCKGKKGSRKMSNMTIKRNQNKMYGGDFNTKEKAILKDLLKNNQKLNFSHKELNNVMKKLNSVAHVYWRHFSDLGYKIIKSDSKEEFNEWLAKQCSKYASDTNGATDDEYNDGLTDDEDDNHGWH